MDEGRATMQLALSQSCFSVRKFDLFFFNKVMLLSHSCFSVRKFDVFNLFYLFGDLVYGMVFMYLFTI
jgi:hypothetical protein